MSILLIVLFIIIVIYLAGKAFEYRKLSRIVNVKTGKTLPHESFFSQIKTILPNSKPNHERILENVKKYGPIYGRFITSLFNIIIADPDVAKQCLLNSKSIYKIGLQLNIHSYRFLGKENVLFSNGESWQNQRSIMNPAFVRFYCVAF